MALQLDNLVEYWGDKQLAPMLFVNAQQRIVWHNRWAKWLFQSSLGNKDLRQLPAGKELAAFAARVRKYRDSLLTRIAIDDLVLDVEGRMMGNGNSDLTVLKFHTPFLSRGAALELHKLMQDFALEAGDRVNNPLTTVLNCLNLILRDVRANRTDRLETYVELAIREAHVMKEFGDWVRRLSEEPPLRDGFNLLPVLTEVLDRRNCLHLLDAGEDIPPVQGCPDHARIVLGGLVNLMRQASEDQAFTVRVRPRGRTLVTVEINTQKSQVKDLRMLTEEFYGGLGLLAARYLLALMQAQLELEFMGDIGIRVTFIALPDVESQSPLPSSSA